MSDKPYDQEPEEDLPPAHPTEEEDEPEPVVPEEPEKPGDTA